MMIHCQHTAGVCDRLVCDKEIDTMGKRLDAALEKAKRIVAKHDRKERAMKTTEWRRCPKCRVKLFGNWCKSCFVSWA